MNVLWQQVVIQVKLTYRDRQAMFFAAVFPVFLLVLFLSVLGGSSNPRSVAGQLAGVMTISILIGTLFGIGAEVAKARETGVLRRYQVTPAPAWALVGGIIISRYVITFMTLINLVVLAVVVYRSDFNANIGVLLVIYTLGMLTLAPLGYLVSGLCRTSQAAMGLGNILLLPMILMSGATVPFELLPLWIQQLAQVLPATPIVEAFETAIVFGAGLVELWPNLVILLGFGLGFTLLAIRFFRWE